MSLLDDLKKLQEQAEAELAAAQGAEAVEQWRIRYLGAKGEVKAAMQRLKDVPKQDKPAAGQAANRAKNALQAAYDERLGQVQAAAPARQGPP